jgi:hypothetical protein
MVILIYKLVGINVLTWVTARPAPGSKAKYLVQPRLPHHLAGRGSFPVQVSATCFIVGPATWFIDTSFLL